jgi:hypothetical protein
MWSVRRAGTLDRSPDATRLHLLVMRRGFSACAPGNGPPKDPLMGVGRTAVARGHGRLHVVQETSAVGEFRERRRAPPRSRGAHLARGSRQASAQIGPRR